MSFPNPEQQEIIKSVKDSLLVLAPMGTGKTRTAAGAIGHAISCGIEPERILGLTFTNRAAEAMRSAVAEALPKESHRIQLFNLHGLCARLLREEGALANLPPDFSILDEEESSDLLWQYVPHSSRQECYRNKPKNALGAYERFVVRFLRGENVGTTPLEFIQYRDALNREGSVDFTGLIGRASRILHQNNDARERWQNRFSWMLVDEVQDINIAEYQIISILAKKHKCLKFFGDTHQTIYEWRFAQPVDVLNEFNREFSPKKLFLKTNYRCGQLLVDATNALRREYIPSDDAFPQAHAKQVGDIFLNEYEDSSHETRAVVNKVESWHREGIQYSNIAVLARENRTLIEISQALKTANIPHLVADDFDFFRRQEVKDITAVLEYLVSPFRRQPILRLLKRFGAPPSDIESLEKEAMGTGLHLGYLVRGSPGDPLNSLIKGWSEKKVIGIDTETTGLDPNKSEVIQFSRVGQNTVRNYSEYIKPLGLVGDSVNTHGLTDDFLALHGKEVSAVLADGMKFNTGEIVLGHNLSYDMSMLRSTCRRHAIDFQPPPYFDTMPIAAATLPREQLNGLRLGTVAKVLGVTLNNAHNAEADANACLDILGKLMPVLKEKQTIRLQIIAKMQSEIRLAFRKVTQILQQSQELESTGCNISDLILGIWNLLQNTSGYNNSTNNSNRTSNVQELAKVAGYLSKTRGTLSLSVFLEQVSLSRRDMTMDVNHQRVRLLTAHAAKGLEFDAVILPRLLKPWSGYTTEEARIFYVMLTRARKSIWMSWPKLLSDRKTQPTEPLKYLSSIRPFL